MDHFHIYIISVLQQPTVYKKPETATFFLRRHFRAGCSEAGSACQYLFKIKGHGHPSG